MKNRIVLLGPPASGKGTQAEMIRIHLNIPTISPGLVLREEERAGTELGRRAALFTNHGQLAPDAIVVEVVRSWFERNDGSFVFDGFPRSIGQAELLEDILQEHRTPLEIVLLLEVPEDVIRERVTRRRVCSICGEVVGVGLHVANEQSQCPRCGGELMSRADDTVETLNARLEEYEKRTAPLIPFYEMKGLLSRIDAARTPEAVFASIRRELE